MSGAVIVVRDLWKTYAAAGAEVTALGGVSFTARPGEFLVVAGPSGSGKSTLLHVIGGMDRPSRGEVEVSGRRLTHLSDRELTLFRRRLVGMVFQFFNLFPTLSARENIMVPLLLDGLAAGRAGRRADDLLELVGLGARAGHLPEELSGGEVQRIAVARALALAPPVLLADEPTGNLDRATGDRLMGLLRRVTIEQGRSLVMVTHDPAMAAAADRTLTLVDGRLSDPA
ncbi:ABC transporter ATP-binding protein [bacterium]|nr:ABC transporter ATP-binding protein [candidate division CSSED10-310 bacterium]